MRIKTSLTCNTVKLHTRANNYQFILAQQSLRLLRAPRNSEENKLAMRTWNLETSTSTLVIETDVPRRALGLWKLANYARGPPTPTYASLGHSWQRYPSSQDMLFEPCALTQKQCPTWSANLQQMTQLTLATVHLPGPPEQEEKTNQTTRQSIAVSYEGPIRSLL